MDFDDFHEGAGALSGGLPAPLWKAYRLKGGEVFADQICIFKVLSTPNAARNPFSASGCQFVNRYEIRDCPERDCKWYAFLPIHPDRRATCASDGLAEQIDMRYIRDRTTQSEKICVTVALPSVLKRTREYPIDKAQSSEKGRAVFYVDSTIPLDMNSWPLIAVWPGTIGEHWKKYYVARGEFATNCLRIYGEEGTGVASSTVTKGNNPLAVQLEGPPDAIPFVRLYPDGVPRSVGVVTPKMEQVGNHAPVSIEVAVDFGTSSTRVYYQTQGQNNPNELFVQDDGPVEVSVRADDGTLVLNRNKADTMSRDFISPYDPSAEHVPLFSMFQCSLKRTLVMAPPILEGVIYQPSPTEKMEDLKRLITDLKRNGQNHVYFTAFLQQLCLHVMSMLYKEKHVNNIVWRFALPKAMNPSQVEMMNMIWKGANGRQGAEQHSRLPGRRLRRGSHPARGRAADGERGVVAVFQRILHELRAGGPGLSGGGHRRRQYGRCAVAERAGRADGGFEVALLR